MINNENDVEHGDHLESSGSSDSGGGRKMMGFKVTDAQLPHLLVIATSLILLIAVITWESPMKSYGYAISVPIISMVISIGSICLTIFLDSLYTQYGGHITHVLFLWNFTGACFLTFSSPFTTTGNGYFAAWGCVATSAMAMGFSANGFRSRVEGLGPFMGLAAFSAIVIIALVDPIGKGQDHGESIFGMTVAVLTIVFLIAVMQLQKKFGQEMWFVRSKVGALAVFALLWLLVACFCTFKGPFNTTGNGYFAVWGGAACAFFSAFTAFSEIGFSPDDVVGFLAPVNDTEAVHDGPTGLSATIS